MAYKLTRYIIINAGVSAAVMLEVTLGRSNWRQEALLHHPAAGNVLVLGWSCFTASTVTPRCCVASSRGGLVSGPLP